MPWRNINGIYNTDFDIDWRFADFSVSDNTPRSGRPGPEPTARTIMQIQGAGHLSPFVGQRVVTSGVVAAVGFDGFYLQDLLGDGDDATSDAIFVSAATLGVARASG